MKKADEGGIHELFPNARFISLPTGHWVHAEGLISVAKGFLKG